MNPIFRRIRPGVLLVCALLISAGSVVFAGEIPRPNIIFLIADDMYLDMLNWTPEGRGRNLTPTLDPKEQRNLAPDPAHAARLEKTKRELRGQLDHVPGRFAELKPMN
jgi:hypothetical protein